MTTVGVGSGLVLYLSRKGAESWSALSVDLSKAVELRHKLLLTDSTDIPVAILVSNSKKKIVTNEVQMRECYLSHFLSIKVQKEHLFLKIHAT